MSDHHAYYDAFAKAANIIAWICYPIGIALWYLALSILFVLRCLYAPVAFLLQPVVYLGRFIVACLVAPFTLAAKLETIYIYLGVAAIVGILGGLFVRSIYAALRSLLRLDAPRPLPKPKLRTIKQHRAQRQEQKKAKEEPALLQIPARHLSPGTLSPGSVSVSDSGRSRGRRPRSILAQTIMEEDDSDF